MSGDDKPASFDLEIRQRYAAIRSAVAAGAPITVLHIGDDRTALAAGRGAEADAVLTLDIGAGKTAAEFFKHNPPTPGEMENAIAAVEDALLIAKDIAGSASTLFTMDDAVRAIARIAGVSDSPQLVLSLDATERTFDRLASVVAGMPAAQQRLPASTAFAATLLILRECMHHLRFSSITVTG